MTQPTFVVAKNNGVLTYDKNLYGTRPLIVDSPWLNPYTGSNTSQPNTALINLASDLNEWLMSVMQDNAKFKSGQLVVHGSEDLVIGNYAKVPEWNEEFYLSTVAHTYVYPQSWQATLGVVRGRPL